MIKYTYDKKYPNSHFQPYSQNVKDSGSNDCCCAQGKENEPVRTSPTFGREPTDRSGNRTGWFYCGNSTVFEAAVTVGIPLLAEDKKEQDRLATSIAAIARVLPKRGRGKNQVVDDDF